MEQCNGFVQETSKFVLVLDEPLSLVRASVSEKLEIGREGWSAKTNSAGNEYR